MPSDVRLVEENAVLTIGVVRRSSVLDVDGEKIVSIYTLDGSSGEIALTRIGREVLELRHSLAGYEARESVQIGWVRSHYGPSATFICPMDGRRCSNLHYMNGRFASRQAHRLIYRSQILSVEDRLLAKADHLIARIGGDGDRGPARGANRERLLRSLQELVRCGLRGAHASSAIALLDAEAARTKPRRRRPRPGDSPYSTRPALYAGRTRGDLLSSSEIVALLNAKAEGSAAKLVPRDNPTSPATDYPEIDIRWLKPKPGFSSGHQLLWPLGMRSDGLRVLAQVELPPTGRATLKLLINDRIAGTTVRQDIEVQRGVRDGDVFLKCPVNGTIHVKLHFRNGYFGSAQALRLVSRRAA